MAKLSFPQPGWYSRGSKTALFEWDGDNWTGESQMQLHNEELASDLDKGQDKLEQLSEAKPSVKRITIPLALLGGGAAAAVWYWNRHKD